MNWEGCGRKWSFPNIKSHRGIFLYEP